MTGSERVIKEEIEKQDRQDKSSQDKILLPFHSLSLSSFSFFISTLLFSPMRLSLPHLFSSPIIFSLLSSPIIFSAIFSNFFKLIQRGRYCGQGWISSSLLSFYANCMSWYGREDHVTEGATPLQYDMLRSYMM